MNVKFIKSAACASDWINDSKPEIAFIGRSNVGKSSLINAFTESKIAKTSNTPGRTQLINFFDLGNYRIVDLPGYGYARVSHEKKAELKIMINEYFSQRENLKLVFQVCDINVLTSDDQDMAIYLRTYFSSNHFILMNKIDKYNKSFFKNNLLRFSKYLDVDHEQFIPVSALKKQNLNQIYNAIERNLD
ncbi:MAG: ribosome biogenesis GTP-binding protein YihA/YsxC [Mycoplasmoidaceae bacterium]